MTSTEPRQLTASRVASVDIFRGLTMLVMIFVNDVSGVKGLPWWTYHMPEGVNGMTYVDMVFPSFLFIVGMSIPMAIRSRMAKGDTLLRVWAHVLTRAISLIVLGLFLANWSKLDAGLTGMRAGTWAAAGLVGFILLWNVYPRSGGHRILSRVLKYAGLATVVVMFAVFRRRTADGQAAWLSFSYWEILGLIGRAYLATCILYIPFRKKPWAPAVLLTALCALSVATRAGWGTQFFHQLPYWLWPFDRGELPSVTMAGVVASTIFLDTAFARTFREKARLALLYASILFAAGWLLSPFGISKNNATPSWCLYCSASSVLLFLGLYWLTDVRKMVKWAAFVKPAGSNTLLTYLLPDIFYALIGWSYLSATLRSGLPGTIRSFVFVALILGASALLTRWKIRMQL